jgi:ABC-2 type transport system ATP-binding protein
VAGRRRVGYLPENLLIPRHHTAATALEYYGNLSGLSVREVRDRREALLEQVGLADWAKTPVRKYSKGMRQRLGLAQSVLHDPELLVLDEPTDGLDPVGRSQVREMLKQLKQQGKTIFLNSHLLAEVEMVCDRIAILQSGLLRFAGSVDEVKEAISSQETLEVDMEVAGDADAVGQTIAWRQASSRLEVAPGQFRLVLRLSDQAAVDEYVDDLRCGGISIVGLSRRRMSLEDAFLSLVKEEREQP